MDASSYSRANGSIVCVKFVCRLYGSSVHKLLADSNLAPALYGVLTVNAIWSAVVMEHLEVCDLESLYNKSTITSKEQIITSLQKILELFQRNRCIHGDLLSHNVFITTTGDVKILDFDRAGKAGEIRYPIYLNTDLPWPNGVAPRELIAKEHDETLLQRLIKQTEECHEQDLNSAAYS